MWYLIKSLFRYAFKNKLSTFLLTVLLTISVFLLLALSNLSANLQGSYNKLVSNGNLANIVINENYSSTYTPDPNLDEEQAKEQNKIEFKNWLTQQNVAYRDFLSLDYTNTANGKIVKVVSYNNLYDINKLVIYNGNKLYDDTFDFNKIIELATKKENNDYSKNQINIEARREIIYLASKAYWTDGAISTLFNTKAVELLRTYNDVSNQKYDPLEWNKMGNEKNISTYLKEWLDVNTGKLLNKNYSLNFEIYVNFAKPKVIGKIVNFSSQFGVVPDYVLKNQNKKYIPNDWYLSIKEYLTKDKYLTQNQFDHQLMSKIPDEYKIYVDSLPYIIVGDGISPDFMYPVYSFERITPNINEEVLLYTSNAGYNYSLNANRSNNVDSYIVAKYHGDINSMVNKINQEIPNWMTTAGNQWAFKADDTSNTFQPCGVRLQFLPQLVNMQIGISNSLSIFILVLAITIFVIMLKKFISDNQTILAILRSNGYEKRTIIWSTCLLSLFPSLVGGIIGYLLGFLTQPFALSLYSFYWVIPTALSPFSLWIFALCIIAPFLVLSFVSLITCYFIVKKAPTNLMNESTKFSVSKLSKIIIRPLPRLNILTKFRLSVAFSSISRLIVLIIMISLSSVSLMFAFGTSNKFEEAKTITYVDKKYKMAFDLVTPTVQGGQYFRTTFENAGKMIFDENKNLLNYNVNSADSNYRTIRGLGKDISSNNDLSKFYALYNTNNPLGEFANNHVPSINDGDWQKNDINYLKNKIESQLFVDVSLGGTNAWDIARNLSPENVQNYSNRLVSKLLQLAFNDETIYFDDATIDKYFSSTWSKSLINKVKNKTIKQMLISEKLVTEITKEESEEMKVSFYDEKSNQYYKLNVGGLTSIKEVFYAIFGYLFSGLAHPDGQDNNYYSNNFYKILYNYVPMNIDDETYTYIKSKSIIKNNEHDLKIMGIKPNTEFIKLNDINGNNLNDQLFVNKQIEGMSVDKSHIHQIYNEIDLNKIQSMIINESAKYEFGLNIGDIIEVDPQNEATRYNVLDAFGKNINNHKTKFRVTGVYQSSQAPEFYINQRVANKMLNLDSKRILASSYYDPNLIAGDVGYQIDPYNGFFSIDEKHKFINNSLVLYTISGIGIANDKFFASDNFIAAIDKLRTVNNNSPFYLQQGRDSLAIALGCFDENQNIDYSKLDNYFQKNTRDIIKDISSFYGTDPYFSLVNNVESISMYMQLFDNTSFLTNSLLIMTVTIISVISILSMVTIALDLLNSSLSIAGILKALGYSDTKNIITFTSIFIPALLITMIISIPITMYILGIFKTFIYSFSNILLPLSFTWWLPFVSLALIGSGIAALMVYTIFLFKKKSIVESIARY